MSKPIEFQGHPWSLSKHPPSYRAVCKRVLDGDTIEVSIDLGLRKYAYEEIRLKGVDTPEIFHPRNDAELQHGLVAKLFVEVKILHKPILITTYSDSVSYGRFVAAVQYWNITRNLVFLSDELISNGFVKRATY